MSIALKKNSPNSKRRKIRTAGRDGASRRQTLKMPNRSKPIDPLVRIGHVHLKVADLERALNFYCGVLGFELMERHGDEAAFVSAGGYHHHIGLNTWDSAGGSPPPGTTGLYHFAILYPTRAETSRRTAALDCSKNSARWRQRSRRERSPLSARPGPERHRTLLGSPARPMATPGRQPIIDVHAPARFREGVRRNFRKPIMRFLRSLRIFYC
jgi:hypothetical protein